MAANATIIISIKMVMIGEPNGTVLSRMGILKAPPDEFFLVKFSFTWRFQESSATGLIWAPHEPEAV